MDAKFQEMYRAMPEVDKITFDNWCEDNSGLLDAKNEDDILFESKIRSLKLTKPLVNGYIRVAREADFEESTYVLCNGDMTKVAQYMLRDIIREFMLHFCKGYLCIEADEPLTFAFTIPL
jgi:hypothetical protein